MLCAHTCACVYVRVCCSHPDQQRDPEHPCADELEHLQKKKNQAAQGMAGGMGWGHPTLCGAAKPEQDALCASVSLLAQA